MSSPYFRPLTDPGERTIRVLRLDPNGGSTDRRVFGCLKETSLDDPVPYSALSYRWGADPPHIPVALSTGNINITTNGYAALVELYKQGREVNVWIDAICINQSNKAEKAVQVAMMDQVYSRANKVIVWLGEADEDADQALEWCERVTRWDGGRLVSKLPSRPNLLNRRMRRQAALQVWEWTIARLTRLRSQPPQQISTVPDSVQHLFAREWFSRMWTVQEVALAHEPLVMYGSKSIYWSHLVAGIQHASKINRNRETITAMHAVQCVQFFWICLMQQSQHQSDERYYGWFVWTPRWIKAVRWSRWLWSQALKAVTALILVRRYFSGHWRLENHDVDAWVFIILAFSFLPLLLYSNPPDALAPPRSLLRDALVVNVNRVRRREAQDLRDKVFALYGTLQQLHVPLDAPQYTPEVGVADVYHRFTIRFIDWHQKLDILIEACWPPMKGAPTWVLDLRRAYERWDVEHFHAAGSSRPQYWFEGDRILCTTGLRIGTVLNTFPGRHNPEKRRIFATDTGHVGASPAFVEMGDVAVLVSGLCVPMVLRRGLEGLEVVGMAEVDGIMDGQAWRPSARLEVFRLI